MSDLDWGSDGFVEWAHNYVESPASSAWGPELRPFWQQYWPSYAQARDHLTTCQPVVDVLQTWHYSLPYVGDHKIKSIPIIKSDLLAIQKHLSGQIDQVRQNAWTQRQAVVAQTNPLSVTAGRPSMSPIRMFAPVPGYTYFPEDLATSLAQYVVLSQLYTMTALRLAEVRSREICDAMVETLPPELCDRVFVYLAGEIHEHLNIQEIAEQGNHPLGTGPQLRDDVAVDAWYIPEWRHEWTSFLDDESRMGGALTPFVEFYRRATLTNPTHVCYTTLAIRRRAGFEVAGSPRSPLFSDRLITPAVWGIRDRSPSPTARLSSPAVLGIPQRWRQHPDPYYHSIRVEELKDNPNFADNPADDTTQVYGDVDKRDPGNHAVVYQATSINYFVPHLPIIPHWALTYFCAVVDLPDSCLSPPNIDSESAEIPGRHGPHSDVNNPELEEFYDGDRLYSDVNNTELEEIHRSDGLYLLDWLASSPDPDYV